MIAQLIDGKAVAETIKQNTAMAVEQRLSKGLHAPGLAVILVGHDPASEIYVRLKRKACEQVGIQSFSYDLPPSTSQKELLQLLEGLNEDPLVHGILVQLPLPEHIDASLILERIKPEKDVDGFHPYNMGRLAVRSPLLRPCTPKGIMLLLDHIKEPYKGREALVIGASNVVGRPMALELLLAGATVTVAHRFTADLAPLVQRADIVVAAAGKPNLVQGEWVKTGATVIDVGIHRKQDGKLCGDVDFDSVKDRAAWITPVPGGVGPMTVACLLENTIQAAALCEATN